MRHWTERARTGILRAFESIAIQEKRMNAKHAAGRSNPNLIGALLLVPLLAACAGGAAVDQTVLPARIDYACANNRVLPVARSADGRMAAALVDGQQVNLPRTASAAQEKYSDGRYTLYLDGERAMLEDQGRVLYGPCVSPVALPSAPRR
jgi:membrane-bound inhibitor of C-type lysozyme